MDKLLSIGMCTYDDFDGVYFSLQSLRMHHLHDKPDTEIIIVDNNPTGDHAKAVQDLCGWIPSVKYVKKDTNAGTASRNEVFNLASGKYTICMDCHVIFPYGSIDSLLKFYAENPDCKDLVQGPMMYDNLTGYATHFKPTWGGDMYGQWSENKEGYESGKPFDIPMMGLGVFSCETKNWRGFNPMFRGFGGEEGYIHEKFRQHGGRSLCHPEFKWLHRFGRPRGVKYPLILEDRIWNYFVGWLELKQDPEHPMIKEIYENFKTRIPENSLNILLQNAIKVTIK